MRYGKIPDRGGAKNPYSEHNPFPKAELKTDMLKPGYREEWLKSLESTFQNKPETQFNKKKTGSTFLNVNETPLAVKKYGDAD